jgi:hypothetical protein
MSQPIDQLMDSLPTGGLTVRVLGLLDYIAPGQWRNTTGFDNAIREVTGESDPDMVARVRDRTLVLWHDSTQGYQQAVSIYRTIDTVDAALGAAALAHTLSERFSFLSFLGHITPNQDKAQATDLALKLAAECVSFCRANGLPGDSVGDFVSAVASYEKENFIRMAAMLVFNGLIPLGPDFAVKLIDTARGLNVSELENHPLFLKAKDLLPGGGSAAGALSFITDTIGSLESYVSGFAGQHGITLDGVLGQMRAVIDFSDDKLDYLAAMLNMSTNYMTHTGVQSVSRSLISRAVGEI